MQVSTFILCVSSEVLLKTLKIAAQEGLVGGEYYWISTDTALDRTTFKGVAFPWYLTGLVAIGPDVNLGETERETKFEYELELPSSVARRWLLEDIVTLIHKVLAENLQTLKELDFHEYGDGCSFNTTYIVPYNFRHTLSRELREKTVMGRTGKIQLDDNGRRVLDSPSLGVYNFVGTNPKVVKAGKWDGEKLEFETDLRFYSDFQRKQRTLRIGIIRDEPFVFYDYLDRGERSCKSRDLQNTPSSSTCYSGIIISLLEELCRNLDFHCTYHESSDGTSGVNQNGSWTGLLGMLDNDEIDITGIPFAQTLSRLKAAHFSTPILDGGVYMVLNPTEQEQKTGFNIGQFFSSGYSNDGLLFLSPFSLLLWMSIGVACVSLWVLVWIYDRYSPFGHRGGTIQKLNLCNCEKCVYLPMSRDVQMSLCPHNRLNDVNEDLQRMDALNALWMMASSIVQVIPIPTAPRSWSSRLVATSWWLVCLIMVAMYSANLTATMTRFSVSRAIRTVHDLMKSGSGISFGTVNDSVTEQLLRSAEDFTLREFHRRISYVDSFDEGVKLVREGSFAFLSEKIPLQYVALKPPCNLYVTQHKIVDYSYSLLYNKRLKYREDIDRGLLYLRENNVLQQLWNDVSSSRDLCDQYSPVDSIKPLQLGVMSGVFTMALTLMGVSLVLFFLEMMRSNRVSEYSFVNRAIKRFRIGREMGKSLEGERSFLRKLRLGKKLVQSDEIHQNVGKISVQKTDSSNTPSAELK